MLRWFKVVAMLTQDRQYGDFRLTSPQLREALGQMDQGTAFVVTESQFFQ